MNDDQLINAVRHRALNPGIRTDQSDTSRTEVAPVASANQTGEAESSIGFPLPDILKRLLQEVGNGGYGPGYGLIGSRGGFTDDQGQSFVSLYELLSSSDPEDPNWDWPTGLVPICHWGCAIYSCVDCTRDHEMYVWDPNVSEIGQASSVTIRALGRDLRSWLMAWSNGTNLWTEMYPDQGAQ